MLQHESQEPAATPAAQIRVTSEELTEAINALQASKDEAARHLAGTVPIGEVVKELNLDATPEEVWAQVQKQRQAAEKAAADSPHEAFHRAAREARNVAAQALAASQAAAQAASAQAGAQMYARPRRRWRGRWWALFGISWAVYGIAHGSFVHVQTPATAASSSIIVNGDNETQTYNANGKDVEVNGDGSTIYLHGKPLSVTVNGDNDTVITDTAENVETNGDNDTVKWIGGPPPGVTNKGHNNSVAPQRP